MEMLRKSVNDFTASLASNSSVPGGGSACALAGALAAALGTEAVGAVSHHGHAADLLLQVIGGGKQRLLILHDGKDRVIIRQNAAQIHGDHRLGALRDGGSQLLRIQLVGAGQGVHQHQLRAHVAHGAGGGGVGVGGGDDLVPGADAQHPQSQLQAGRGGVEAHRPPRAAEGRDLPLKLLGHGAGGDPAGAQRLAYFFCFFLCYIRRTEGYLFHKSFLFS